ncbi:SDR family NAD(P)-dependent oxidoreductase [Aeromicrobium wangtongii]|uniref:SDR family oxidoreductase n=2 Tax=Aeromicrobium wangtongii TaxID=2969247 RepID=A0ABY5MC26_9ACTN|nr:SDR family oxidoreductase [Aeromicrobium wangtongii]UUP14474.1 SDR family oxidoreductase [Aeromicrobium wangtongii]
MSSIKVAIVTGASSGIGRAIATTLASEGWALALVDSAKMTEDPPVSKGDRKRVLTFQCDVTDEAGVKHVIDSAAEQLGGISALVNSAAVSLLADSHNIENVSVDDFRRTIDVNLTGTFITCKYAMPWLRQSKGSIVNLASTAAILGGPSTAYPSSKGGVAALTRSIAHQYASVGVRCNAVLPGPTDTPMLDLAEKKGAFDPSKFPGMLPRKAEAREIAELVAYLVSDKAGFITGSSVVIDGGLSSS